MSQRNTRGTHSTPISGRQAASCTDSLHRAIQRWAAITVAVALVIAAALTYPVAAEAGSYTIANCPSAAGHPTATGPWQIFGQTPSTILETGCAGANHAMYFANAKLPSTPIGFRATTAGTQLSIVAARIWWRAFGSPTGAVEAETQIANNTGELLAIGQADGSGELYEAMTIPEDFHLPASDHATTISFAEHCFEGDECPMTESFGVGIEIFGSELTLNDETAPAASIDSVASGAGGSAEGSVQTTFTATDPDAGIKKAELLLDGAPVATHDYSSSCSFTKLQPCPATITDRLESPPVSFLQGAHELAVRVTDAAENTTVVPVPPLANGVPCPSPAISLTADHRPTSVTIPFDHSTIIEGRLGCGSTPVPGAKIAVGATAVAGAPTPPPVVETAADGTFRFQLPAGPSRSLTLSYRAYSSESSPAAAATVKVNVRPRLTLRIKPKRSYDHGTIYWSGQVLGGPYPISGMQLDLQVRVGRRWQTFDEVTVEHGNHGKWGYKYTFKRTSRPTTYAFRAALLRGGDVGYPYTEGASPAVRIRVR